jgi:hypothetical protein
MKPRTTAIIAAAAALWSGAALAATGAQAVTLENRAQLIAARMSQGESYDRASRAVPQVSDERSQAILDEMSKGSTYRKATLTVSERADVVNARWNKHQVAMVNGGAHEAGWAASSKK